MLETTDNEPVVQCHYFSKGMGILQDGFNCQIITIVIDMRIAFMYNVYVKKESFSINK